MGQAIGGVPGDPEVEPEPGAERPAADIHFAIGVYLARQREMRGISLQELARDTRIPLRSLERLENGAFDQVHDGFVRGFVRTVAASLGLDPDETVARMLDEPRGSGGGAWRLPPRTPEFVLAGLAALLLGSTLWWALGDDDVADGAPGGDNAVVVRRDAVRSLAAEHGMLPEPLGPKRPPASDAR